MSTKTTELNNSKSYLRKISRNNNTYSINIPLSIVQRQNLDTNTYMVIEEYEDSKDNKLTFRKIDLGDKV